MSKKQTLITLASLALLPILMAPGCLAPSDRRLKKDISKVGRTDLGIDLYRYRYLWSEQEYVGVMAQDVAAIRPDAVIKGDDGYLRVDYAAIGARLQTLDEWARA